MRSERIFAAAIIFVLLSGIVTIGAVRTNAQSIPPQQQIILHSGYYQYLEVDSFSNSTWVEYSVTSSNPISVALMNKGQFFAFSNNTSDEISNSITYQNGTSVNQAVNISPGQYFLVLYAYGSRAIVDIGYYVYPNTPFTYGALIPPYASGIASYGIKNVTGVAIPYEVQTSQIIGVANISSFLVNNPDAAEYGDNVAGATLQLNSNLVVNENNGAQDIYWVQNTPDFVTSNSVMALTDNIWNNTDLTGILSNQSITSTNFANGGAVYVSTSGGTTSYAYLYNENNVTYKLPYSFALVENESVLKGQGVLVQLGYRLLQNGTLSSSSTSWYDNVTINAPNVTTAYYDVAGNATTPIGSYFDSEFVFAGEGNYETTQPVTLSASLGLFFKNQTTGVLSSFPSYYSFGGDTGEAINDTTVTFDNGIAYVQPGDSNYVYLGTSSLTLGSNYRLPSFATPPPVTTTISTQSNQNTQATTTFGISTTTAIPPSSSNSLLYVAGAVVVIVVFVAVIIVAVSRRKPQQAVQTFPTTIPMQVSPYPCPNCGTMLPPGALFCSNCGQPQQRQT